MEELPPEQVMEVALTPAQEADMRLAILVVNLHAAKKTEDQARRVRIATEELIAAEIPTEDTGQKTVTLNNGGKVTVKRSLSYKAELDDIQRIFREMGQPELMAPVKAKTTRELDVAGYEWYRQNHPDIFRIMTPHVSVTPRKVSVTLKAAKE